MAILFPIGFCEQCNQTVVAHSILIDNENLSQLLCVHCDQPVIFPQEQEHFAKEYQLLKYHYHVYQENESPQQSKGCGSCSSTSSSGSSCGTYYRSHS